MDDGHCGLPADELIPLAQKLLEVSPELVETALALELQDGTVIADNLDDRRCIFLASLYHAEREIAGRLRALAGGRPPWPSIDADKAIPWVETRTRLALADSQCRALRMALDSNVLVITGGPGVGKTTLVNSILKILAKNVSIALCAPTGRAAKRLSDSTGLEAKTIHRLLETDPKTGSFRRNDEAPLDCDLLVVDETSMVDVPLMRSVLRALPARTALHIELQKVLDPPGEIRIERFGWTFCPGDKVMQIENDYDREDYNGDLGIVSRVDMEDGEITVDFEGREVVYGFGELDELVLAYATTIHKSQGSEYPAIVMPLRQATARPAHRLRY
jgi:ATP-dependent exoDNAse (exonuclease V) alpha subunit